MKLTKEDAISFLIQCFFGEVEDPIVSAIDKAYFDMQTHTISGEKNAIFEMRKGVTEILRSRIVELPNHPDFEEWHRKTSEEIKAKYENLSFGKIQKWINMSIKYLFTLKMLDVDGIDDYFIEKGKIESFHAPLDSFVLHAIGREDIPWSKIETYEDYLERKSISFVEEYKNWSTYSKESKLKKSGEEKKADKGSYKRYIQEHPYEWNNR